MEKGEITMKIEKEWSASSKPEKVGKGEELVNIAERWGIGVDVCITKPYIYSQGPVEKMIINKEIYDTEKISD